MASTSAIDRLAISAGRAADPARVDEFVTSPTAAAAFGFHVGEIVPMGFYTNSQTDLPGFGTATVKPYRRIDMRLVGIGLPVTEIVTDDVDAGGALGYFTPALTRQLLSCCVNYTETAIKVANPDQVAGLKDDITRASPGGIASRLRCHGRRRRREGRPSDQAALDRTRGLWGDHRPGGPLDRSAGHWAVFAPA